MIGYVNLIQDYMKPDILTYKPSYDTAYIIDTQISTDNNNTNIHYLHKTNYYNNLDIIAYAR